jgi:hypothetical protein
MHAQYVAGRCSCDALSDASLPQGAPMAKLTSQNPPFSTNLSHVRTKSAETENRRRIAAEAAVATFGEKWSRRCQTPFAPLWRSTLCFSRPLAPRKLKTRSSMSMSRPFRSSPLIPANTSNKGGRGQGFLSDLPAQICISQICSVQICSVPCGGAAC